MIYEADEGMAAVMFPVRAVSVYAETEPGRRDRIPGKKAIINTDTRRVFSVVGQRYQLLENRRALRLARRCRIEAFPNTAPGGWRVEAVEAPKSGGHCRIDLHYDGKIEGYDWSFGQDTQDRHFPFVRVTNSYNTSRVFSIHFGFTRYRCMNSVIADESVRVSLAHTEKLESRIVEEINEAKFRKLAAEFEAHLKPLRSTQVPAARFRSIILSVLEIHRPEGMPEDREKAWATLERIIDAKVRRYVTESGANAYALLNAITDLATDSPGKERVGYSFIRRERHSLQMLAGTWLTNFSTSVKRPDFDLDAYVKDPTTDRLRPGIGRRTRGFRR